MPTAATRRGSILAVTDTVLTTLRRSMSALAMSMRLVSAACLPILSTSCAGWEAGEHVNAVAWADDDSEIALVEAPDGSGRRVVTGEISGLTGDAVHHMKRAGFFVFKSLDLEGRALLLISDAGVVSDIAPLSADSSRCMLSPFDAVPSPSGETIAVIVGAGRCNDLPGGSVPSSVVVRLLEATTLSELRRDTLAVGTTADDRIIRYTWRPTELVVAIGIKTTSLAVHRPAQQTSHLCFTQKTSSSTVSSTGRKIASNGMTVRTVGSFPDEIFGCP